MKREKRHAIENGRKIHRLSKTQQWSLIHGEKQTAVNNLDFTCLPLETRNPFQTPLGYKDIKVLWRK